jgi:purine-nucleoside phosphorylase
MCSPRETLPPSTNLARMSAPIGLAPTAPLAERVLLPGDPARALFLSQVLLEDPKMFNHHRGLWGYTGRASDGAPLTIQSTGMGGPSAAIVTWELAELGAKRLLRVGTCGALDESLALGDLLVAREALTADGTSRALGAADRVRASPEMVAALEAAGGARSGVIATTDLFYDDREREERRWMAAGAIAVEMEAATIYALAAKRGLQAAALLTVSDVIRPTRVRIGADALRDAERRMGELAVTAMAGVRETA